MPRCFCVIVASSEYIPNSGKTYTKYENYRVLVGKKETIDKIHDQKDVERITREIKILKKVRHPNVIQLYEIIETEKELYMIMEYANNGELFDYIVRHTRLSEK